MREHQRKFPILASAVVAVMFGAAPAIAQDADWTGFTFGAGVGFGEIDNARDADDARFYSLRAGYAHDLGDWVLGGRIVYDRVEVPGLADTENHYTSLHLTAGYDMGDWMPYAIGGFASLTFRDPAPRRSDRGWLYGAGAAWAMTPHDILSAEVVRHFNRDFVGTGVERSSAVLSLNYDYRF